MLPDNVVLSVNTLVFDSPYVTWGYQENTSPGYDIARDTGVYTIEILATMVGSSF